MFTTDILSEKDLAPGSDEILMSLKSRNFACEAAISRALFGVHVCTLVQDLLFDQVFDVI